MTTALRRLSSVSSWPGRMHYCSHRNGRTRLAEEEILLYTYKRSQQYTNCHARAWCLPYNVTRLIYFCFCCRDYFCFFGMADLTTLLAERENECETLKTSLRLAHETASQVLAACQDENARLQAQLHASEAQGIAQMKASTLAGPTLSGWEMRGFSVYSKYTVYKETCWNDYFGHNKPDLKQWLSDKDADWDGERIISPVLAWAQRSAV